MKILIEEWKTERKFSIYVSILFDESVTCFKHSAYRASLLFSYLSFLTFIKESLMKSKKPDSIPQSRWDKIIKDIQNDDKWESRVYEELINSSSPIFNIKEDLRQQIKYWKDRRNDCAHYKSNEIESHHVEAFWSFLKSNLSKITIEGGRANLLNKFKVHFDETKTPPDSDFTHLVKEIENAVDITEIDDFITDLSNTFNVFWLSQDILWKIFNKIFALSSEPIVEKLSAYIKTSKLDIDFIASYPDKINFIRYENYEIRELWKKRIYGRDSHYNLFDILSILLRNNLIPAAEKKEAFETLFKNYDQKVHHFPESKYQVVKEFEDGVFADIIYLEAIQEDELKTFMWVNDKCDLIAFYFKHFPLQKETVKVLCEMVSRPNYSYWLKDSVIEILRENTNKKDEFHKIANDNGYDIPEIFK